jgi:hypothetical protein
MIGHCRSVSFSDGKRDGPNRGLSRDIGGEGEHARDTTLADPLASRTKVLVPSARSQRIEIMMGALEDSGEFLLSNISCFMRLT